jgi:uncharacterized protein YmfQ (DUF2313 family)
MEARRLTGWLPPILQDVRELRALLDHAEQPETDALREAAEDLWAEQFIGSAAGEGLARWEGMMRIPPAGDTEARRRAILLRLREVPPYTWHMLKEALDELCGADNYEMTLDHNRYELRVRAVLTAPMAEIRWLLARWLPANISAGLDVLYRSHGKTAARRHRELAALTHKKIREEM